MRKPAPRAKPTPQIRLSPVRLSPVRLSPDKVGRLRRSVPTRFPTAAAIRPYPFYDGCGDPSPPVLPMTPGRKRLPHDPPDSLPVNPEGEVYFITICCMPRGENQLASSEVWRQIDESLRYRENLGQLRVRVVLAMPDHLHGLFAFPSGSMAQVIGDFKRWISKSVGVIWQRDFFDHRLRTWESAIEKSTYIRNNPVRAGLVERAEDWPYQR
jgi:putative transposase